MNLASGPIVSEAGHKAVTRRLAELAAREKKRSLTEVERYDRKRCERAEAELTALDAARARAASLRKGSPLHVVYFEMDELDKAKLDYSCLNLEDVMEVNRKMKR